MSDNINLYLIGTTTMAQDYYKVLKELNVKTTVVGKGEENARIFFEKTGVQPLVGGVDKVLDNTEVIPTHAIVAVGVESLMRVTIALINKGVKELLVEKPGGLNRSELEMVESSAKEANANVYIAYNRRYYASVRKAEEIITKDGGVKSFHFEFTEWGHKLGPSVKKKGVKEAWLLANSSHVIDLAFYLGGFPRELTSYSGGTCNWHPTGSIYTGAGISNKDALFSYSANWGAPGRWSVEILTDVHRIIFRPIEKLQMQDIGSIDTYDVKVNDENDLNFKPGLLDEVQAFIFNKDDKRKVLVKDQLDHLKFYEKIENV